MLGTGGVVLPNGRASVTPHPKGTRLTQRQVGTRLPFIIGYSLTLAGGAAFMAVLLLRFSPPEWEWWGIGLATLALLLFDVKFGEPLVGGGKVMSSKSIIMAALVLYGAASAAMVEAGATLIIGIVLRRKPLRYDTGF